MTRARMDAEDLCARVVARGGQPVLCPLIRLGLPEDLRPLDEAAERIDTYDAIVIGSIHAAQALAEVLAKHGRRASSPVACVGAKTAEGLSLDPQTRTALEGPRWVPETFRAESLVERIRTEMKTLSGRRFLFPRAPEGRTEIIDRLEADGASVDAPQAYRIVSEAPASQELLEQVEGADAWTFLSGNTLEAAFDVFGEVVARRLFARAVVAVIGPVAAERAVQQKIRVDVVPDRATAEDLLDALEAYFAVANGSSDERS